MGSKSWHVVAATAARALHISLEKPQGTKHVARSSRRPLPGALLSLYGDYPLRHNFGHVARAELARSLLVSSLAFVFMPCIANCEQFMKICPTRPGRT